MVVLTIIAILVAVSAPSFQRAVEQSRADIAVANLRAIWSAERLYWLEYHAYTSDLATLQSLGLLDRNVVASTTGYSYSVPSAGASNLSVAAARVGSPHYTGEFSLDETGQITGAVTAPGEADITPGFQ